MGRLGEGVYRALVGKPEGKKPLGRPRRKRVDNIIMELFEELGVKCLGGKTVGEETTVEN